MLQNVECHDQVVEPIEPGFVFRDRDCLEHVTASSQPMLCIFECAAGDVRNGYLVTELGKQNCGLAYAGTIVKRAQRSVGGALVAGHFAADLLVPGVAAAGSEQ